MKEQAAADLMVTIKSQHKYKSLASLKSTTQLPPIENPSVS